MDKGQPPAKRPAVDPGASASASSTSIAVGAANPAATAAATSAVATESVVRLTISERRKLSDEASDRYQSYKICFDSLSKDIFETVVARIPRQRIQASPKDSRFAMPALRNENNYQDYLVDPFQYVLEERCQRTPTGLSLQIGGTSYHVRVVREAHFSAGFCGNFFRYTTKKNKPDFAAEIYRRTGHAINEATDLSNAVLAIEVKWALKPEPSKLQDGLQQISDYLVTKIRPVKRDGERWLLHGLLLYQEVGYLVKLRSNDWLDYPWECVSVKQYEFQDYEVVQLLRTYVAEVLGGATHAEQLFKLPKDLGFPKYPADTTRLGIQGNVVTCKWHAVSAHFPQTRRKARKVCTFSKLPLDAFANPEVVLKIVSPVVYPYNGPVGSILSALGDLLVKARDALTDPDIDDEAKQRLSRLYNLYVHSGDRGQCESSSIVVTLYRGLPVCTIPGLHATWADQQVRTRCFEQVCLLAFDVVQHLDYAHGDFRPPNIVFDGVDFMIIDWESVRTIKDKNTGISGKADSEKTDQRYPSVKADNNEVRWLLASACQLYMCIYIIDETAQAQREERASEVEGWFHEGGDCWKDMWTQAPAALVHFRTWREHRMFAELHNLLEHPPNDVAACRILLEAVMKSALRIA